MTIDEIYQFVQFLANKDQRGYIKPSEFNLAVERAQLDEIKELIANESTHQNYDKLRTVIDKTTITYSATGNGAFTLPSDYLYFLSATFDSDGPVHYEVEMVNHDQLFKKINSTIVFPSSSYPIGVIMEDGIEIYNNTSGADATAGNVVLNYVKIPAAPVWTYQLVNNMYVYDASSASLQQLTLPESTHQDIISRVVSYLGVSLREADLVEYSELKMKDKE